MKKNLIPHCERLAQVGKNVHSQLVRPTVKYVLIAELRKYFKNKIGGVSPGFSVNRD